MGTLENVDAAYESAVKIILQWDLSTSRGLMISKGDHNEINQYLEAVDEIHRRMASLTTTSDDNNLIKIAMARLEEEFVSILTGIGHSTTRYSTSSSSISDDSIRYELVEEDYLQYDAPSENDINDLRSIAGRMKNSIQVYRRLRKGVVDVCFQRLGIEKLNIQDMWRLEWRVLEVKITHWIRAAKFCVRIFFPKEKQLCEQIFASLGTVVVDFCFRDAIVELLDFVDVISSGRRSPERLFKFLDLHEALSDLLPELDILLQSSKSAESIEIEVVESPIRTRAVEILSRLAEAVRGILLQLENEVNHEHSTILVPSGTVHSLTRYVMDYTSRISDYKPSLTSLIVSKPKSTDLRYLYDQTILDMDLIEFEGKTPLELHLIWIIVILLRKLEVKSKHYEDAHLFMMNNVHYIVKRIKDSPELRMILDDEFSKIIGKVQLTQMMLVVDSNGKGLQLTLPNKKKKEKKKIQKFLLKTIVGVVLGGPATVLAAPAAVVTALLMAFLSQSQ